MKRRELKRLGIAAGVGLLLGSLVWTSVMTIASYEYWTPNVLKDTHEQPVKWVLVIGRQEERETALEEHKPHRNSPMALYECVDGELVKREGDLVTRSHSTADQFPTEADWETVRRYVEHEKEPYPYGFVSAPTGLYLATPATWGSGITAYLLSSIQNRDGYINLDEPQTIRYLLAMENDGEKVFIEAPETQPRKTRHKSGVFLHPTPTRFWSHRDSQGCLNLYTPADLSKPDQEDDYGTFLEWMESRSLTEDRGQLLLLLEEMSSLGGASDGELPLRIPASFLEQRAKGVTLKW